MVAEIKGDIHGMELQHIYRVANVWWNLKGLISGGERCTKSSAEYTEKNQLLKLLIGK